MIRTFLIIVAVGTIWLACTLAFPLNHSNGGQGEKATTTSPTTVELVIGTGWYNFTFANSGSYANNQYHYITDKKTLLKVTDVFWAGDTFAVFDNGTLLVMTDPVPASNTTYTALPDVAFSSIGWSSMYAYLPPGEHLITIITVNSPYNAGGASIRADYYNA